MTEPRINATLSSFNQTISTQPGIVLFVGQKTVAGTAVAGSLVQNIQNDNSENTLFGENSMLAEMVRNFKRNNQNTQIDAIPLDDAGGAVAASGNFVITGTATEAGSLTFVCGSRKNYSFKIDVPDGATATVVGDALEAAITANTKVPVTAVSTLGDVVLTAVNAGEVGNSIGLEVQGTVAGITVAITAMASGATNPTVTGVFDIAGDQRYRTISAPYEYGLAYLTDYLGARFNSQNIILDGVAIIATHDTLPALVAVGGAQNSPSLVLLGFRNISTSSFEGNQLMELDYAIAAQFCALRALRLTDGTDLSSIVLSDSPQDAIGGVRLNSLPYANTPFAYLIPIDVDKAWRLTEEKQLNAAGVCILANNSANNTVVASRIVTAYKTDAAGNPDPTFGFLNLVDTSSAIREIYFNQGKSVFAQSRLTLGDAPPQSAVESADTIYAFCVGLYVVLADENNLLTSMSENILNFYKQNLNVEITNFATGDVTVSMRVIPITQLRTINIPIQVTFSTAG